MGPSSLPSSKKIQGERLHGKLGAMPASEGEKIRRDEEEEV